MNTCAGGCCEKFYLNYSREIINREAQQGKLHNSTTQEMRTVAEMVLPLEGGRCVGTPSVSRKIQRFFVYTCRHWDPTTRLCGIYARRPVVCRTHPPVDVAALNGDGSGCSLDKTKTCTFNKGTPYDQAVEDFKAGRP